jgi:hypothetical protein
MNVRMTIGAHDVLLYMYTGIMFGIFFFVAALAVHLFRFDLALHVLRQTGQLDMATVAAILAVYGIGKGSGGNLVAVTTQAGGRINGQFLVGGSNGIALQENEEQGKNDLIGKPKHAITP